MKHKFNQNFLQTSSNFKISKKKICSSNKRGNNNRMMNMSTMKNLTMKMKKVLIKIPIKRLMFTSWQMKLNITRVRINRDQRFKDLIKANQITHHLH